MYIANLLLPLIILLKNHVHFVNLSLISHHMHSHLSEEPHHDLDSSTDLNSLFVVEILVTEQLQPLLGSLGINPSNDKTGYQIDGSACQRKSLRLSL